MIGYDGILNTSLAEGMATFHEYSRFREYSFPILLTRGAVKERSDRILYLDHS
jgi:hypothetical protein